MARSLLATLIGYLTFAIPSGLLFGLSGRDPHVLPQPGFLVGSIVFGVACATLGGYLAAVVARRKELHHAAAVAGVIAVLSLVSLLLQAGEGSLWSQLSALLLAAPAALAGGFARARSRQGG